ncbi:MAG: diacylglycerol kinase family lipid kinase [Ignavibacteriales bacterium]|nr:diacylglycerol kinase family lipid kinase [Ignavibacteriales bacterium]
MAKKHRERTALPHFILNPAASAGKTGRIQASLLLAIEEKFPGGFVLDVTTNQGHATEITRQALNAGTNLVVAVGGDGTINEVVNGFLDKEKHVNAHARLGFLCIGTAKDVARNLNLPDNLSTQLDIVAGNLSRMIDLGKVSFHSRDGNQLDRFFINDCQPGIAAMVVRRVTPALKRLGGFLAFGIGSTLTALTYRARYMSVSADGTDWISGRFLGVTAANGRYAGGGMDFAPASRVDDGLLDLLVIKDQSVASRLINFPKIYTGKHIDLSWIEHRKAKKIRISSPEHVALEADGELIGFLPCEISVVPRFLRVAAPDDSMKKI